MAILSRLVKLRGHFAWNSFERMLDRPKHVQTQLLLHFLHSNRNTLFGRHYKFSEISTVQSYRDTVPIGDYEHYRPWVEQIKYGKGNALTTDIPHMFTLTSGTSGEPKFIPVNKSTQRSSSKLSSRWIHKALVDHPSALDHKALVIVSPAIEGHTENGVPFGSSSGHTYQHASWAIRHLYTLPYSLFTIKDYHAKYYSIMRWALEHRISLVATPNPSTILRLVMLANDHSDQLIQDIHDGTLSSAVDVPSEIRQVLLPNLMPNPKRANQLLSLINQTGSLSPKDYWPDLQLVGCWKGGTVGITVNKLRTWFRPDTPFRDIGYLSTEAQVTVPIQDEGSAGILSIDTNFYEFIPESKISDSSFKPLTIEELLPGENYYIIITSPNGLYRYDINDIIKVSGYYRNTPLIEFIGKGRDMVSIEGEKLHVGQLIKAVVAAQLATGIALTYYVAEANINASRYYLKLEFKQNPIDNETILLIGRTIDRELGILNIEYFQKRNSGRLHPPHIFVMTQGWAESRLASKMNEAIRDTQFKDAILGFHNEGVDSSYVVKSLSC